MTRRPDLEDRTPAIPAARDGSAPEGAPIGLAADGVSGMDPLLEAKLWRNPCWFSFRINYTALRYNRPLYDWIRQVHGLSRPEYAVIYSLGIGGSRQASQITHASGHPKNTLSRAIARLEARGLLHRDTGAGTGRNQSLSLTPQGQALFDATLPRFVEHERKMLSGITEDERATLSRILAKVVLSSNDWPTEVTDTATETDET